MKRQRTPDPLDGRRSHVTRGDSPAEVPAEPQATSGPVHDDMRTVLDALPSLVGSWDRRLCNRSGNATHFAWFGIEADQLPGRSLDRVVGPALYERLLPRLRATLDGQPQQFEESWPNPITGAVRYVQVHALPEVKQGCVDGCFLLMHDVTPLIEARLDMARALRQSEAFLDAVRTHAIVSITDRAGTILDVNDKFCEISEYGRDELVGANHRLVNSGVHDREFWTGMWGAIGRGAPWRGEVCNRAKSGRLYWVDSMIAPIPDLDGRVERFVSIRQDVTERRNAQIQLAELASTLQAVLDASSAAAIIATDLGGRVRVFNSGASRLLGYTAHEVVGLLRLEDFHDPAELQDRRSGANRVAPQDCSPLTDATWLGRPREWTYVTKEGSEVPVSIIVTEIRGADDELAGHLSVAVDNAERKEFERKLAESATRADAANRAKSEFLANMSHEIRTPLHAMLGLTYMLERSALPTSLAQMVAQIQHAGRSLLGLVNDVLDLARIESGRLEVEAAPFDLHQLVGQVVHLLGNAAQAKGLAVNLHIDPAVPPWVVGDAARLRQILNNLLGNAIKFTTAGSVSVKVAPGEGADGVSLVVTDTGIGIPEADQARLFQPFTQAETSTTRRYGGSGLGLSIVARLCTALGGAVTLQSEPGKGSCFTVSLPLPPATDPAPIDEERGIGTVRVLLAEGDHEQREHLEKLSRSLGWQVDVVSGGRSMVSTVLAAERSGHPFQALVVDWKLPDLDGLSALAAIRQELEQRGRAGKLPPAVVISADDLDEVRRSEHAELATSLLSKPLDGSSLFDAVIRAVASGDHVAPASGPGARGEAGDHQWLHGVHVLVADDSSLNLDVARHVLELEGARVTVCMRGEEAIDLLSNPDTVVDVVLMDVQMPGIDGNEAVRRLRRVPHLQDVPVIALSAAVQSEDRARAIAAGMTDFLPKPVEPERLIRSIRSHVERRRGAGIRPVRRQVPLPAADSGLDLRLQGIDSAMVAPSLLADRRLYLSMLRRFLTEFGGFADPAMGGVDDTAMRARLHKLRGSAQVVGAAAMAEAAGRVEAALKNGDAAAASTWRQRLVERTGQLVAACADVLQAEAQRLAEADQLSLQALPQPGEELDPRSLRELRNLLERQSLDAVALFRSLESGLRRRVSPEIFLQMRSALDEYDFARLRDLLREIR